MAVFGVPTEIRRSPAKRAAEVVSNAARSRILDTINQINPSLDIKIDVMDNIIMLLMPEGTQKPYSCSKGFYLCSGPNSQKLERDSIIEFFQNEGRVRYDAIVREDLPISERFNDAAFRRYINLARISEVLDRKAILQNLNCAELVRGKLCFTNVGALFFRTNDEDVVFRHAGIVCALFKGTDKAYILDAKEFNGDMVSNIDDAVLFLKKHLRLSFKIEGLRRENILELPEDALREAIVNAVCHRDYFENGARVMVEIFDDRVDIVSPGGVCKGITEENFGMVSITRNSVLASMLYRIDYIEQMGTGIMRMKKAALEAEVSEPEFKLSDFFKVTFRRNEPQSLASDKQKIGKRLKPATTESPNRLPSDKQTTVSNKQKADKRMKASPTKNYNRLQNDKAIAASGHQSMGKRLKTATTKTSNRSPDDKQAINAKLASDRKLEIAAYLRKHKRATITETSKLLHLSKARARAILQEMIVDEAIEKVGNNRYTYYVLK